MKLVPIENVSEAERLLYQILSERPKASSISHKTMPNEKAHSEFVMNHPYRYWFLIWHRDAYIGDICVTPLNEVGIHLRESFRGRGLGKKAISLFLATHDPLPAITAVRRGRWLANVSIINPSSKVFFEKIGFKPIQQTMILE